MAVAERGLHTIVGNQLQVDGGIRRVAFVHHRGVLGARLIVGEHAYVLQALQLQLSVDVLRGAVGTEESSLLGLAAADDGRVVAVVGVALQASVDVVAHGAVHVAEKVFAHLHGELAHVELAKAEPAVGDVVVEVVGIDDEGRLLPVDGATATPMSTHVDVAQLVDVVLHRHLRDGVNKHLFRPFGLMLLVVVVVVGEDGEEHVALHVEVGEGVLVEHVFVFVRHHVLLDAVLLTVGFHVEIGQAVEGWHLEDEMAALGHLCRAHELTVDRQFGLDHHLALQAAVVHAQLVVGIGQSAIFNDAHIGIGCTAHVFAHVALVAGSVSPGVR